MASFVLHQYALSPFAAKMRAMLGYAEIEWQSAITQEMPPRPILLELAGGYRKIPVAQIGADIFCDTRCISEEIASQSGQAQLKHADLDGHGMALAEKAEAEIFFASAMQCGSWKLLKKSVAAMSVKDMGRFIKDRVHIGRNAKLPAMKMGDAKAKMQNYLQDLEQHLEHDFLYADRPNAADFSVFVSLWIVTGLAEKPLLAGYPKMQAWMQRMESFDKPPQAQLSGQECLDWARQSDPRPLKSSEQNDPLQGKPVAIAPADYACDASSGILVASTPSRWVIARDSSSCGAVHVHFPKRGFDIAPFEA